MPVSLQRTFGKFKESQFEEDEVDWSEYLGSKRGRLTWEDLHKKRVAVVLGEAGIGKTVELQLENSRLNAAGCPAFFLPLNLLRTRDDWLLALGDAQEAYANWSVGNCEGYFFLDAVDEARLQSHADFTRALGIIRGALAPHMSRVRIVISSRITDWTVPEVASSVATHLLEPIRKAVDQSTTEQSEGGDESTNTLSDSAAELFVVTLDALSREEATRCSLHFGLRDCDAFWNAVDDGDYDFMASRPLDLRWMVELWNQKGTLGRYLELVEVNVEARLREVNPNYHQARRALSESQLRNGAAELAASAEFGGFAFIAVQQSVSVETHVLDAYRVLGDWEPIDVQLLLATAIFDEASFNRIKFHHRSIREYLAARWVDAKLTQGVPLGRLESLFVGRPFGELTLIPSRRAVLSWLAAINVRVRAWVVSKFPELLLHEGDAQSWDMPSAELAFAALIEATKIRRHVRWFISVSQYSRVSRVLGPGKVASILMDAGAPVQARSIAYRLALHGKLKDCANPAFDIYQDTSRQEWERAEALAILAAVGTASHRAHVQGDVESGAVMSNQLIANALPCFEWSGLTPSRLAAIFNRTQSEGGYGSGPMAQAVTDDMLPTSDLESAGLLLTALLETLPCLTDGKPFARFPVESQPERAWILDVLPDCLERVLELGRQAGRLPLEICIGAAERIEAMRDTGFTDRDEFRRLFEAIKLMPSLRWDIALAIAQSEEIRASVSRLTWGNACIVSFETEDLPELTRRTNDPSIPTPIREICFQIGTEVAFRLNEGRERASVMRSLCGKGNGPRLASVLGRYKEWRDGARTRRAWKVKERGRKAKREEDLLGFKSGFLANLEGIAEGKDITSLRRLIQFAINKSSWSDSAGVDCDAFASEVGQELATAFAEGLKAYWRITAPPNPSNYPNGEVPWEALAALSGTSLSVKDGLDFRSLTSLEVSYAAQIAVWSISGPPNWFHSLYMARSTEVVAALNPWVLAEVVALRPGNGVRGAFAMAMSCPPLSRRELLAGATTLVLGGSVTNESTLKELLFALYEDGLLPASDLDTICQTELARCKTESGRIEDLSWLKEWAAVRPHSAWDWFMHHLSSTCDEKEAQVNDFASAMCGLTWLQQPWDGAKVELLLAMSRALGTYKSVAAGKPDMDTVFFGPPIKRLFDGIAKGFVGVRGALGHDALQQLTAVETDEECRRDINGLLVEHAELEAAAEAHWDIARLRHIHGAFDSEPRNEAQLFEQALARLEEIRTSIQEGPFSERILFTPGMPEKHLQLWLAAKYQDTQNLRFSVHREEEVDDDKRTDIQLACATAKVCIEIKPLDSTRSYSASSLVEDTLKRQLVGQYLKGRNSSRGILVLMQLDGKRWNLPDATGVGFDELVRYLQTAADQIKLNAPGVAELLVFGIRCSN